MDTEQLCPEIMEIAEILLSNGFRVFRGAFGTYLFFATGDNIGYVQYHSVEGYRWSTVHKQNRDSGTGLLMNGSGDSILSMAYDTAKTIVPVGDFGRTPWKSIKKFKSVDEFLKYKNGPTTYLTELSLPL